MTTIKDIIERSWAPYGSPDTEEVVRALADGLDELEARLCKHIDMRLAVEERLTLDEKGLSISVGPEQRAAERERVFLEIDQERAAQDAKWGGPAHDDGHGSVDWIQFIREHTTKADVGIRGRVYRRQLVRVAALAVAAIEAHDRAGGER